MPPIELENDWKIANDTGDDNLEITNNNTNETYTLSGLGELAASALNTDALYTNARDPDVVVAEDSNGTFFATGPNGLLDSGAAAATVIQSAIDGISAGRIVVKGYQGGTVNLNSQVVVKSGRVLDTHFDTTVVNKLTDTYKPALWYKKGSRFTHIQHDADGTQGVRVGEDGSFLNEVCGHAQVKGAGTASSFPNRQAAIQLRGTNGRINNVEATTNSSAHIHVKSGADWTVDNAFSVNPEQAVVIPSGGANLHFNNLVIDSPSVVGFSSDSPKVTANILAFYNTSAFSGSTGAVLKLGEFGSVDSSKYSVLAVDTGGSVVEVHDVSNTTIDIVASNTASNNNIQTGINYAGSPANTLSITANLDNISSATAGTPAGLLNGVGYEAAGAGNSPTASNWISHQTVENTDDNTIWIKTSDGSFTQI